MLNTLTIKNFVLIEELHIDFRAGFSVITGETGAGKSVLLGALQLLMGQRADTSMIRKAGQKCIIEASFNGVDEQLRQMLADEDLDQDSDELIIRRELNDKGKSRAFVNDSPTSLAVLKLIGEHLIDIHSQHKNLLLSKADFQLSVLDLYAQDLDLLKAYQNSFAKLKAKRSELKELQQTILEQTKEKDFLEYQYEQIEQAELKGGELTALEEEEQMLTYAQDIKQGLSRAYQILDEDDQATLQSLNLVIRELNDVERYYDKVSDLNERLNSVKIELRDISQEISSSIDDVEVDPERLSYISDRLNVLNNLLAKHHVSTEEELLQIQRDLEERLLGITTADTRLANLEAEIKAQETQTLAQAEELHSIRLEVAKVIEQKLIKLLQELGMPYVRFQIDIKKSEVLGSDGITKLTYLFSSNKETALEPVADIASGGEISRLMLGLKALIANRKDLPTIIFDEIDTGVSGDIADKIARILRNMGKNMQVMAVTHLPQIAAAGAEHYFVFKEHQETTTKSYIKKLRDDERVEEIARMQSGNNLNEITLAAARELLEKSK